MDSEKQKQPEFHQGPPAFPTESSASRGREASNLISDTVIGVNLRWKDNFIQGIVVLVFGIAGAAIFGWYGREQGYFKQGLLFGGLIGLVVGVLLTGIFIMCYRGLRHLMGKHD